MLKAVKSLKSTGSRSKSPSVDNKYADWEARRPNIIDRFKLHSNLMSCIKKNEKIKMKMVERDKQIFKIGQKYILFKKLSIK